MSRFTHRKTRRYNLARESIQPHEEVHTPKLLGKRLPPQVDLSGKHGPEVWPVLDQGAHNTCTANALAGTLRYLLLEAAAKPMFQPSRLFIFWDECMLEGKAGLDVPVLLSDGVKAVVTRGVCPEDKGGVESKASWPYEDSRLSERPSQACFTFGKKTRTYRGRRLPQKLTALRHSLASGVPFVVGIQVFPSFHDAAPTGDVQLPAASEKAFGGHAIMITGYDHAARVFRFRNSEGAGWGKGGFGTLPYEYLTAEKYSDPPFVLHSVKPEK